MTITVFGRRSAGSRGPLAEAAVLPPVPRCGAAPASLRRTRSAPSLHVPPEGLLHLAAGVALGHVLPLVVGLLALRERERGLDLAVLEVQVERDEGQPALLDLADQFVDLGAVHEHLALAARGVVGPGALHVLGDVDVLQPHLAVVDRREPVDQRGAAGTQALHLGAGQREADLVGVEDRVVVPRLLVLGDELSPGLTRHAPRLPGFPILAPDAAGTTSGRRAAGSRTPRRRPARRPRPRRSGCSGRSSSTRSAG